MNETLVLCAVHFHARLSRLFPEPPPEGSARRAEVTTSSTLSETASFNTKNQVEKEIPIIMMMMMTCTFLRATEVSIILGPYY